MPKEEYSPVNYNLKTYQEGILTNPQRIWEFAARYYQEDAQNILDIVKRGHGVLVHAPKGSGKSSLLGPQISQEAAKDGSQTGFTDGDFYIAFKTVIFFKDIKERIFRSTSQEDKKILIIDELTNLLNPDVYSERQRERNMAIVFSYLQRENIAPIGINVAQTHERRLMHAETFRYRASRVGIELEIHEMKQRHLPPDLVQIYLTAIEAEQELLDLFSSEEGIALLHPRSFSLMQNYRGGRIKNVEQLIEALFNLEVSVNLVRYNFGGTRAHLDKLVKHLNIAESLDLEDGDYS